MVFQRVPSGLGLTAVGSGDGSRVVDEKERGERARLDRSQSGPAVEGTERQSLEIGRQVARATYETSEAVTWGNQVNTEADTCRKFVVPRVQTAGWEGAPHGSLKACIAP